MVVVAESKHICCGCQLFHIMVVVTECRMTQSITQFLGLFRVFFPAHLSLFHAVGWKANKNPALVTIRWETQPNQLPGKTVSRTTCFV